MTERVPEQPEASDMNVRWTSPAGCCEFSPAAGKHNEESGLHWLFQVGDSPKSIEGPGSLFLQIAGEL